MKRIGIFVVSVSLSLHAMQDDGLQEKIGYACTVLQECATSSKADAGLRNKLYNAMFLGVLHMPLALLTPDLRTKVVLLTDEQTQASLLAAIEALNTPVAVNGKKKGEDSFSQQCVNKVHEYGSEKAVVVAQQLRVLANQVIAEAERRNRSNPASPTGRGGSFVFGKK
ncbi:hypothetical protein [Methylicorpusculum sp.]|uniref:hypothetical protein n=1 Tax=Methylicorpusculum sp. TaxID=2713644 RepID=UPI002ABA0260|nr:hypothetical protein [Methylicorpusculum sp.]MDZ4153643.1 hypothetical protein [Methylicorpusculum sp.]